MCLEPSEISRSSRLVSSEKNYSRLHSEVRIELLFTE